MKTMADMRMVGQGIRRRMGAPMSSLQAAGDAVASPSRPPGSWTGYPAVGAPDSAGYQSALAGMAKVGNPRVPMGQAAIQASPAPVLKGKLVSKKGNAKGGLGSDSPNSDAAVKKHVLANEHNGPRFGIRVSMPAQIAEQTATYANGRIVPGVMGQRPEFDNQVNTYGSWGPR